MDLQILKRKQLPEKYCSRSLFLFYPFIYLHTWLARASHKSRFIIQPTCRLYQVVQISTMPDMCQCKLRCNYAFWNHTKPNIRSLKCVLIGECYGLGNIQHGHDYVTSPNIRKYFHFNKPCFVPCNRLSGSIQKCHTGLGLLHKIINIHCFIQLIWIIAPVLYCTHAFTTARALFVLCAGMAIGEGLDNCCD